MQFFETQNIFLSSCRYTDNDFHFDKKVHVVIDNQ